MKAQSSHCSEFGSHTDGARRRGPPHFVRVKRETLPFKIEIYRFDIYSTHFINFVSRSGPDGQCFFLQDGTDRVLEKKVQVPGRDGTGSEKILKAENHITVALFS